ncbi:Fe(3+)-siderophore ABC transporter permease [Corynebacterium sp. 13CS0277]|uniref:FecCD family ABC transporter permease n=1 Tax=Corynebacterium sp. 13CS0277 TaxID=2071994 RepID=UPI000D02F781|nr:iron chelate uptake ABC transporter family permease subunit [Corynebacterium sp. 13CS0277]PRQ10825.1 Fe(3+)-siderophore ABC transporter permease [Corynebacterium sp. 13CS0277]
MSRRTPTPQAAPDVEAARAARARRYVLLRLGPVVLRAERRALTAGILTLVAALLCGAVALTLGDYGVPLAKVPAALYGLSGDPMMDFFVGQMRAPRVLLALVVGAALGVSGGVFQTLTRNPLGSPDITGFTTGAATGALIQIIVFEAGALATSLGALVGGLATGAVVYLLAKGGGMNGTRFVLIGIGVAAILQGMNSLLIVKGSLAAAQTAAIWMSGSFNATTWPTATVVTILVGILIPGALYLARPLAMMTCGDELATGLGVNVPRTRILLLGVAIALVAVAVAAAGPIGFVALAAPHISRKVSRTSKAGLAGAAVTGALIVVVSDIIAQRIFAPTQLPVGVVTGVAGGCYLVWLLANQWRNQRH